VTEAITGYDLVEWQIRIAAGERLPALQHEIRESGHAIEARITAERADQGFRPDAGRIEGYREPGAIRIDSGVRIGSEVTLFYDSLLAKAIAAGSDRAEACARLAAGLRDFAILGPATTLPFLADAVEHKLFAEGRATTRFIEEAFPEGWVARRPHHRLARAAAALLWLARQEAARPGGDAWAGLSGFRILAPAGGLATSHLVASEEGEATRLEVRALPDGGRAVRDEDGEIVLILHGGGESFEVTCEGRLLRGSHAVANERVSLMLDGESFDFSLASATRIAAGANGTASGSGAVNASMPGVVAEVRIAAGERVEAGQVVVVLESMKLFTSLTAEIAGVVSDVACRTGETVSAGKRLVLIEPAG
jgi:3-methylcrotonyl-CoA carboxylase alpha subunit